MNLESLGVGLIDDFPAAAAADALSPLLGNNSVISGCPDLERLLLKPVITILPVAGKGSLNNFLN